MSNTDKTVTQLYSEIGSSYDKNTADAKLIEDCNSPGAKFGRTGINTKNSASSEGASDKSEGFLLSAFPNRTEWNSQMMLPNGINPRPYFRGISKDGWSKWAAGALMSDLLDLVIEKGFQKSVDIPAGNAYSTTECDIEYTVPSGYKALAVYKGLVTNGTCYVYNSYFKDGKARLVISNLNGSQKTVTAYAFILFVKS